MAADTVDVVSQLVGAFCVVQVADRNEGMAYIDLPVALCVVVQAVHVEVLMAVHAVALARAVAEGHVVVVAAL